MYCIHPATVGRRTANGAGWRGSENEKGAGPKSRAPRCGRVRERQPGAAAEDGGRTDVRACSINGRSWIWLQVLTPKPRAEARGRGVGANSLCRRQNLRCDEPSSSAGEGHATVAAWNSGSDAHALISR